MTAQDITTRGTSIAACVHHWMVEPAGGPTSQARCRHCGDERTFFNNPDAVVDRDGKHTHEPSENGARPTTANQPRAS